MTLTLGPLSFDRVDFDAESDVLYASVSNAGVAAYVTETVEGHSLSFDDSGRVIGLTLLNAKWLLDHDGEIRLTQVFSADEVSPALVAHTP